MKNRTKAVLAVLIGLLVGISAYLVLVTAQSSPHSSATTATTCSSSAGNLTAGDWTTYHRDNSRSGVEPMAGITQVRPAWAAPTDLDGQVYAEPLVCGDAVFVATESDSVYAVNASTGGIQWMTHLGTPVQGSSLPCGDIDPTGITGTPVIDSATGTLYVVAFLSSDQHALFGLDTRNGSVVSRVPVDAAGADPKVEQQRGALALANGVVYIPYGGLAGDCGAYHGWVVGVRTNGVDGLLSYQVPTGREGGIWSPGGISVAPDGNLFVATGNSEATVTFDYGDSVIELSPSLQVLSYFAPTDWAQLNSGDVDLGSVAPTVLPNGDVFQIGKAGIGYLLSGSGLGSIGGQLYNTTVCSGGFGGTARIGQSIIVPCTDGLFEVNVSGSTLSAGWQTSGFDAGSPIVTGDIVWATNTSTGDLLGFNISSGEEVFSFALGSVDHFISPAAGPGRLYVAGGSELHAFVLA